MALWSVKIKYCFCLVFWSDADRNSTPIRSNLTRQESYNTDPTGACTRSFFNFIFISSVEQWSLLYALCIHVLYDPYVQCIPHLPITFYTKKHIFHKLPSCIWLNIYPFLFKMNHLSLYLDKRKTLVFMISIRYIWHIVQFIWQSGILQQFFILCVLFFRFFLLLFSNTDNLGLLHSKISLN